MTLRTSSFVRSRSLTKLRSGHQLIVNEVGRSCSAASGLVFRQLAFPVGLISGQVKQLMCEAAEATGAPASCTPSRRHHGDYRLRAAAASEGGAPGDGQGSSTTAHLIVSFCVLALTNAHHFCLFSVLFEILHTTLTSVSALTLNSCYSLNSRCILERGISVLLSLVHDAAQI